MISFSDFEWLLENRAQLNLLRKFNYTEDLELKVIISMILYAEEILNGVVTMEKLTFAFSLERVGFWKGKVDIESYRRIKTIEDLKEWLRDNLVGKYITVKRYRKNMIKVIDLL